MYDLKIINGLVVDGSGGKAVAGNIAVSDGVITEIGIAAGSSELG